MLDTQPRAAFARRLLRSELLASLPRTFVARGIAAGGSFILLIVVGRLYGAEGVGLFALGQSLWVAASLVACYGMDNALMRFVGRDIGSPNVRGYLRVACIRSAAYGVAAAVVMVVSRSLWAHWFHTPQLTSIAVWFALATPPFAVASVLAGFLGAVRKPATYCLLQQGGVSLLAACLIVAMHTVLATADIAMASAAFAVASWLALLYGGWAVACWLRAARHPTHGELLVNGLDAAAFRRSSSAFFVFGVSTFVTSVLAVSIAGFSLATTTVGLFKAALQFASLPLIVRSSVDAILLPRFAHLFDRNDMAGLARLARRGAQVNAAVAMVPVLLCVVAPSWLLTLAGHHFSAAASLLRVLAIAQFISVSCGSLGSLLAMTGHESLERNINLAVSLVAIAAMSAATPVWGVTALVLCVAVDVVAKNLVNMVFVWKKLAIWTLPTPNLLAMLGVRADIRPSGRPSPALDS